ncbi:MAG: ERF family protein [bacterium]|nr:ERF family protein [bacterium]
MSEAPMIYKAISDIMDELGAVEKKKDRNTNVNYAFRGIDAVMNAMKPLLSKHGVFVTPEVLEHNREERVTAKGNKLIYSVMKVKYTFFTKDGSSVPAIVIGEAMDSGDKASNKAMSVAYKYALFQVFCIPTEEMDDPDRELSIETSKVTGESKISVPMATTLKQQADRTGYSNEAVAKMCGVEKIEDIPMKYYKSAMSRLEALPDRT